MTKAELRLENAELKQQIQRLKDELEALRNIEKELIWAVNNQN